MMVMNDDDDDFDDDDDDDDGDGDGDGDDDDDDDDDADADADADDDDDDDDDDGWWLMIDDDDDSGCVMFKVWCPTSLQTLVRSSCGRHWCTNHRAASLRIKSCTRHKTSLTRLHPLYKWCETFWTIKNVNATQHKRKQFHQRNHHISRQYFGHKPRKRPGGAFCAGGCTILEKK